MLVLLLTVDCLRHDYVNKSNNCTPAITALCESSHLFANAYATGGRTPYSFPSILGSYYRISQPCNKFPVNKPSVAKVFQDVGFRTIGVQAANPYLAPYFNYDSGFDEFEDFMATSQDSKEVNPSEFFRRNRRTFIRTFIDWSKVILLNEFSGIDASKIVSSAIEKLRSFDKATDIFFWMHFMDTHGSFTPPKEFVTSHLSGLKYWKSLIRAKRAYSRKRVSNVEELEVINELYLACIRYVDDNFKELFSWLKKEGWYDDATIIVTSDHGESFMEHGYFEHPPENLYNEQVQVPLVVKLPRQKQQTIHIERVSHIDLFPSVLSYLDIPTPSDFCGKATLFGPHDRKNPVFVCGGTGNAPWKKMACIHGDWKLISEYKPYGLEALGLYNLEEDPQEKVNQLERNGKKVLELMDLIQDFYETFKTQQVSRDEIENTLVKQRLKALGYLD